MKKPATKTDHIASLTNAIRKLHGCESRHVESVPVVESFRGKTIWRGTVEVFAVSDHPKAKRCYAWIEGTGKANRSRFVAVLELPPVKSAPDAVRVAIASEANPCYNTHDKET